MWGYRQVYTIAQIELMTCDVPLVVYNRKKDKNKHTRKEMEDLTRRWKEKKNRELESGTRFNLNNFLITGKIEK